MDGILALWGDKPTWSVAFTNREQALGGTGELAAVAATQRNAAWSPGSTAAGIRVCDKQP